MCQCCSNSANLPDDWSVYGTQFTAPTEYANSFLQGRYRIILSGVKRLDLGIDWEKISGGGFKIMIPGFSVTPDTLIQGEFY